MLKYIVKRLLLLIPILLAVSVVVFLILRLGEGDPAMSYLRLSNIPPTDEALAVARTALGLDQPLPVQYAAWLGKALTLDFGRSYVTGNPVLGEILYYLPNTLKLAGFSLLLTLAISLPLGIWSALYKDRLPDHVTRVLAFTGVSMPSFWLGFLLVWLFSIHLKWLPPMGMGTMSHMLMPAVTMSLMSLAINTRLIRGNMLDNMHARYVLYARARGLPERVVVGRHVLVNSLIPVITAVGMHVGELFGGAVVAESIFSWPGVGRYAVSAIYNRDFPVMQCFILIMTTIFVLMNLCVDILYAWLDPRIRLEGGTRQ
ncbi:nickel ABC transporter permease subunit NikB [Desulfovibrio psychrotolerans]|uniref:Nickel ABC transporter permease subunit NikB n=1 Tax=Desulfovibrio psychrotolerans TaxID=415242 RepID=A0A7J0BSX7_9BACT|nr:nickel ABC transporter permease subunit NikB [Desulfovibrio psychrotolerans]GFM36768.1 nickel ABC transporter permease subunit NikB [Desulfovibrio psychrotolerans]